MTADLHADCDRNDQVLERIQTCRRFKNDTKWVEKMFHLYTKIAATAAEASMNKDVAERADARRRV